MTPAPPITQIFTIPADAQLINWQPCTCNWTWGIDFIDGQMRTVSVRRPGLSCTQNHGD